MSRLDEIEARLKRFERIGNTQQSADLAALVAVVRAVERLHVRDSWSDCAGCHVAWPCPTVQALDGLEAS